MRPVTRGAKAGIGLLVMEIALLAGCGKAQPVASRSTTSSAQSTTSTNAQEQALPPISLESLPVPADYSCPADLHFLAPANEAAGECLPAAYLGGGTTQQDVPSDECLLHSSGGRWVSVLASGVPWGAGSIGAS